MNKPYTMLELYCAIAEALGSHGLVQVNSKVRFAVTGATADRDGITANVAVAITCDEGVPLSEVVKDSLTAGRTAEHSSVVTAASPSEQGDTSTRTAADDLRDFGNSFEINGHRIDPSRVTIHPSGHYEIAPPPPADEWTERHSAVQCFALRRFAADARNMANAAAQDKDGRRFKAGTAAKLLDDARTAEECLRMLSSAADAKAQQTFMGLPVSAKDAARLRMLATLSNNHLYLTRNAEHAPNYQTAAQWIEEEEQDFADVPADELQRMKDTNTIWCLHVYPHTPIGFWRIYGATLEYVLDAAIEELASESAAAEEGGA